MSRLDDIIQKQKSFQRAVNYPIDSIAEADRNDMSEKFIFKMIEEAVELRKEFPSAVNPWSKEQKVANLQRIREEFADIFIFLVNIAIVWRLTPEAILDITEWTQENNFKRLKVKKMAMINSDILKIPGRVSGIGHGNLTPKYVFVGQNPGKDITQGYEFFSNPKDGSSKNLLPMLEELGVLKDCYFTNVVKCTTQDNVEPGKEMTSFYLEFLGKELEVLKMNNPGMKVIAMGKYAEKAMEGVGTTASIQHPAVLFYGSTTKESYKEKLHEAIS